MNEQQTNSDIQNQIRYVSHEIRNHLSICDMYTQIIKRNLEKDSIKNSSINNAIECIQKSLQIIGTNLLELKSINQNSKKIADFETIVLKGIELAKVCSEDEKNINFNVFIKNSTNIYVDENRYLSCIVNIIKNGIEAISTNGIINIIGEIKNGNTILKISNNGKPIPKDKWERIFELGYTTKETGCGLGLGICKEYLKSQNAELKLLKSTKTETTFEIITPIYE